MAPEITRFSDSAGHLEYAARTEAMAYLVRKPGYQDQLLMPESGTAELAAEIFNLPARVGYPVKLGGLVEEYRSPIFSTGVGLVLYGATKRDVGLMDTSSSEKAFSSVWDRMKNWFKEFF